jgi:uncharacterized damage-inducible protein DinB
MALSDVEPQVDSADAAVQLVAYLDYLRGAVARKVLDLPEAQLRTSRLPSGWTPLELLSHLVHMERRWFVWGFLGETIDAPWGDHDADGRWRSEAGLSDLAERLRAGGRRTSEILRSNALTDPSATTGRFADLDDVPTLLVVAFHVLQEYARHVGHLDIARELADGLTGEG